MILMTKELFLNKLKKINIKVFSEITVVKFKDCKNNSLFLHKYGEISLPYTELYRSKGTFIRSAINKTNFWIKSLKDIRKDYDNIDYSKVIYKGVKNKVKLRCKKHNYKYEQRTTHHSKGIQGCPKCAKQILRYSKENFINHKKFFKDKKGLLYVIYLYNEEESFYKVGITSSLRFKYRINQLKKYYKVEIQYTAEDSIEKCFVLEQQFLKEFLFYKYTPNKKFKGYTECLTVNPINHYYNKYN